MSTIESHRTSSRGTRAENDIPKKSKKKGKVGSMRSGSKIPPKKKGRRSKKIIENIDVIDNVEDRDLERNENSAVIVKFNLDPSKLKNINDNKKKAPKKKTIAETSSDDSSEGMFKNDIPQDSVCHKCEKNEKTIALFRNKLEKYEKKEKVDKSTKIHVNGLNFVSYDTGKKINLKKMNLKCRWDANSFDSIPCYLPELFHNGKYYVNSYCFCSFNCALAFNLYYLKDSKVYRRKALVYKLYRELHGLNADDPLDIKEAALPDILKDFGGEMSIETYRRSFTMLIKNYIVYLPPLKPLHMIIEERNAESAEDADDKKYILKRSKPLFKKKSVISSMRGDDDED